MLQSGLSSTSSKNYLDRRQNAVAEAESRVVRDYKSLYQAYMKPTWNCIERALFRDSIYFLDENGDVELDADGEPIKDPETNAYENKSEYFYFFL